MGSDAAAAELEALVGMVAAFVRADGSPLAVRAWGVTVTHGGTRARLLLGATEWAHTGIEPGAAVGRTVALTGADIATGQARQVKGPIVTVEAADAHDAVRLDRYFNAYREAIDAADRSDPVHLDRMVPDELVACTFDIAERFDQTPGPNAGRAIEPGGPHG